MLWGKEAGELGVRDLRESSLRIIRSWKHGTIWVNPGRVLMQIRRDQGQPAYLCAVGETLKVLRQRFGVRAGVHFHVTIFGGFILTIQPARRPGFDTLSSAERPREIHAILNEGKI